ncbi:unnamed protein product [Dovyalis caffra]|uniref:Glutaredoxin domain-containing protein n=1 Tax=Dovyalis caffra TaxID=77055 RepID=A0AAV1S2R4_9ROSI|nr:unnamed protein product [Dovyalis caffra]
MATINLSSLQTSPSLHFLSLCSSQNTPTLSFYSHSKPFPTFSLKPFTATVKFKPRSFVIPAAFKPLAETELVTVPLTENEFNSKMPSDCGIYAVYDKNNDLQFIGISRNIGASVFSHLKSVPELCNSVKVGVVDEPDKASLTEAWKSWMEEHIKATGKVPPGNESGNVTWVRQPPKKKADLRLTPGRHVQLAVPLEELIDQLVKENKVVAFIKGSRSAPMCGFSQRVIGILESEGVDYESVDVLDEEYNSGLRETLKKYSNWPTFPQIFMNGELVGGCDILTSMHEKAGIVVHMFLFAILNLTVMPTSSSWSNPPFLGAKNCGMPLALVDARIASPYRGQLEDRKKLDVNIFLLVFRSVCKTLLEARLCSGAKRLIHVVA